MLVGTDRVALIRFAAQMRKNAKIIDDFVYGLIAERAAKDKAEVRRYDVVAVSDFGCIACTQARERKVMCMSS